jgi:hypothetical protein
MPFLTNVIATYDDADSSVCQVFAQRPSDHQRSKFPIVVRLLADQSLERRVGLVGRMGSVNRAGLSRVPRCACRTGSEATDRRADVD